MTHDLDTRDAIMDLSVRLAAAEEKNADYEADFRATLAEACGEDDRQHCACVPHLRRRIAELDAEVERLKDANKREIEILRENLNISHIDCQKLRRKIRKYTIELKAEVERLKATSNNAQIRFPIAEAKWKELQAEVGQLKKRVESQTDWYQQRFDTLRVWVNNEVKPLSEEVAHRYFSICANGSPAPHEDGEWKDTLHGMRLERDGLKAEVQRLKDEHAQWDALITEQFVRMGKALEVVRERLPSGEPARDDATEVEALVAEAARLKAEAGLLTAELKVVNGRAQWLEANRGVIAGERDRVSEESYRRSGMYEDEATRLRAEIVQLQAEWAQNAQGYFKGNSVQHWMDKATAYGGIVFAVCEAFRSLGYTGEMGDLNTLPARLEAFAATIRAHTGQAEREAVVAWVRGLERDYATILDKYEGAGASEHDCCVVMLETTWKNIEAGMHWKTVGIDPERGTSAQDDTGREARQDTHQMPWLRLMRRRWNP